MESSTYSSVEGDENIPHDWATNQVLNTVNFATNNKLFTWFVGGLNHQVEHHLFPNICHVHYTKLSKLDR